MTVETKMIPVGQLPAVQRDLFLARALKDTRARVETLLVSFPDMDVRFESDAPISSAVVSVTASVSLTHFAEQFERLLDCYAPTKESGEWVLKWAAPISRYGAVSKIRLALCDRIVKLDAETGETVGALKRRRRSVKQGHGTVRLVPAEDSLQLVLRHPNAQGLKALWKSVFHRLSSKSPSLKLGN